MDGGAETAFHYFDCTFVVDGTAILVGLAVLDGDALQLERGTGADMYTSAIIVVTARNDTATRIVARMTFDLKCATFQIDNLAISIAAYRIAIHV